MQPARDVVNDARYGVLSEPIALREYRTEGEWRNHVLPEGGEVYVPKMQAGPSMFPYAHAEPRPMRRRDLLHLVERMLLTPSITAARNVKS